MCPLKISLLEARYPIQKSDYAFKPASMRFLSGKNFANWHGIVSEDLNANIGGAFITDKLSYIFNIAPEHESSANLKKLIFEKTQELISNSEKIWGFICGGWNLDMKNDLAKKSFDIYNTLADKMEELKIPFGMLCGKEAGEHYDNFRVHGNNVYVWSDLIKDRFNNKKAVPQEEIINNLEKDYQFTEFDPEIKLYCSRRRIIDEPEVHEITLV